jgi:hypothetical protein
MNLLLKYFERTFNYYPSIFYYIFLLLHRPASPAKKAAFGRRSRPGAMVELVTTVKLLASTTFSAPKRIHAENISALREENRKKKSKCVHNPEFENTFASSNVGHNAAGSRWNKRRRRFETFSHCFCPKKKKASPSRQLDRRVA